MEHIITSNIMLHLENNTILYNLQHGFRKARSCETKLIYCMQELAKSNNCCKQIDLIIMDFAKAFDKVLHCRLLYKLKFYGIQKYILNWNKAFVSDITQSVVINGTSSTSVPVTSGVPQGTVLGPIIFLTYINDLPEYLTYSQLRLFADDSITYKEIKSHQDCQKIQHDLEPQLSGSQIGQWRSTRINVQTSLYHKRKIPLIMTASYTITLLNLYHLQNTWASHYNRISNGTNTLTILHQMGTNHWAF